MWKFIENFIAILNGIYIHLIIGVKTKEIPVHKITQDCTKLTQFNYDYIVQAYKQHIMKNMGKKRKDKETQLTLSNRINEKMGTNKSRTSLARIWNGTIKRDELPAGKPYFDYDL